MSFTALNNPSCILHLALRLHVWRHLIRVYIQSSLCTQKVAWCSGAIQQSHVSFHIFGEDVWNSVLPFITCRSVMIGLPAFLPSLVRPVCFHSNLFSISYMCPTVCLYSWSFSSSVSYPPPFLSLSLAASFHLFVYLSQRELMWPLCAVSSPCGRQSSPAPIRTALLGAVSRAELQTRSFIHVRRRPPPQPDERTQERKKCKWRPEKSDRIKESQEKTCFTITAPSTSCSLVPTLPSTIAH